MDTTINALGKTLPIRTTGRVLSDGQVLHALRHAGILTDNAATGNWQIGVAARQPRLTYQRRTASGKWAAHIYDAGPISVEGYAYESHSYTSEHAGHISWSFVRA